MDPGHDLFERLKLEGWTVVEGWLVDREPETQHLEFKLKDDSSSPAIGEVDKENVAKTLSAFANTDGGLLVFGVDAGGGAKGGFDRVTRVAPISDAERFGGALERRLRTFTEPPIRGLQVFAQEDRSGAGTGVVAIHVPRSIAGPHRAVGATTGANDRYYMRTAAGAQTIPHSLLAALFAYSAPPRLEFRARFSSAFAVPLPGQRGRGPWVQLRLLNRGRAVVRQPAVLLYGPPPLKWENPPDGFSFSHRRTEEDRSYMLIEPRKDIVVYPGLDLIIAMHLECNANVVSPDGAVRLDFDGQISSLDTPPVHGRARLEMPPTAESERFQELRAVFGAGEP